MWHIFKSMFKSNYFIINFQFILREKIDIFCFLVKDYIHKKTDEYRVVSSVFCEVSCCLFAFLVALVVYASHGASRRIDHVFERGVPLQRNRRATRYRRHRRHTACRLVRWELFFKQRAVVIFLFRHGRIYGKTFVYTCHLCVAYLCRRQCA